MKQPNPIRPTDDEARALARQLMTTATHAALGVLDPETGAPAVTRIAVAEDTDGQLMTLVSDLSSHTVALRNDARASCLLGEPGPRGDPLTHPRLSLSVKAHFIERRTPEDRAARDRFRDLRPKTALYVDFADFNIVRLVALGGDLNGGFGKAYRLSPADLGLSP